MWGKPELFKFEEHFPEYKITVYQGLACGYIKSQGQVDCPKRINLLYVDVEPHYHVIVTITSAMAKRFMCNSINKTCASENTPL